MRKSILIIYASVGLGHKVVAENIAEALKVYPDIEVELLDILKLYQGRFIAASTAVYKFIIRNLPRLWGFFYTNPVFQKLTLPLRLPFAAAQSRRFLKFLQGRKYDAILTTHPTATAIISYLKQKKHYQGTLLTTFSDFHFQPYWVYPRVDRYLVITEEQKREVMKFGFEAQQIVVTGLPVHPVFLKAYDKFQVQKKFGLNSRPLLLLMGGSRGWGVKLLDILALLSTDLAFEMAVVTGTDKHLAQNLQNLELKNLHAFANLSGEEVAMLFSVAKILITKPGGLTAAQALAKALPTVFINPLPTMEEMNEDYLVKNGLGVAAKSRAELTGLVGRLLEDQKFYAKIKKAMEKTDTKKAANKAAAAVIDIL